MIWAETKMALGRIAALIAVLLSLSSSVRAAGNVISDFGGLSGFQSATWVAKDLRLYEKFGLFSPRFSYPPRADLIGVKDTLEFYAGSNPELKNRTPGEFVDHSILEELEKEGFF